MPEEEKKAVRKARREVEAGIAAKREAGRVERISAMRAACQSTHKLREACDICTFRCQRDELARIEKAKKDGKRKARLINETGVNPDISSTPTVFARVIDTDGQVETIRVAENSPAAMAKRLGLPAQHKGAVERLQRDYEVSTWNARAASFEMAVDGSGNPLQATHLHVVEAQTRIKEAAAFVGHDWPIVQATMLPPFASVATIATAAGTGYKQTRDRLSDALDRLADFYTPGRVRPDRLLRACVEMVEKAARDPG
jgi:hypothetical protein